MTKAGKRLLSHVKQPLQLWDTVKAESLASHYEIQGSFTPGSHPSVGLYTLSKFLPKLLIDYPKLEIQLKHDLSRNILEEVINLSIDVGLIVNPIKHPDLIIHKLYEDKVTFWHADGKHVHKQGIKYKRIITSNNLEVIANLTANGSGIGIIPTWLLFLICRITKMKFAWFIDMRIVILRRCRRLWARLRGVLFRY